MLRVRQTAEMRKDGLQRTALSDHVDDLDTCDSCGGGMEGFEAHHWAGDPLDESVVLFQDVVEVFDGKDKSTCLAP